MTKVITVVNELLSVLIPTAIITSIFAFSFSLSLLPMSLIASAIALSILGLKCFYRWGLPHCSERVQRIFSHPLAWIKEAKAIALCSAFYFFKLTRKDPQHLVSSKKPSILLVHGYLHNSSGWRIFKKRLHEKGYDNIFTIDLGHPFQTIQDFAHKVDTKRQKMKEMGITQLILIGHSMGGLICSESATNNPEGIKGVVTISSPLAGSHFSVCGVGECTNQMSRGSVFIQQLHEKMKQATFPFFHYGSETDLLVLPPSSSITSPRTEHTHLFKDEGHVSMIFSKEVFEKITSDLESFTSAPPSAPQEA